MRVRLRYRKVGKVRFTSHRDLARIWERALRRLALPVAYTEGFSPRPRLSFGLALSTGYESDAEYLDVDLDPQRTDGVDPVDLPGALSAALPVGIDAVAAAVVPPTSESLQHAVTSCSWRIEVVGATLPQVTELVERALAADELVVTRQRKGREVTDDLRPAVLDVGVVTSTSSGVELDAELAVHPRSVRPSELVAALGAAELEEGRVRRTHQWISRHGARQEPLDPAALGDATSRPHAEARAS